MTTIPPEPATPAAADTIVWLTIQQAADRIHVTTRTIERYEADGLLILHRLPGGGKRYKAADVDAVLTRDPTP